MKKTLVALFLVAVMALSVCAAAGITTSIKAQAATPTVTTLYAPAFARAGQFISLSGTVKTSTGSPVASSTYTLELYRWYATGWVIQTRISVTSGTFAATLPAPGIGTFYYQARYIGGPDNTGPSTSLTRSTTVKYGTTLSIQAVNRPSNLVRGTLHDQYARPMPNQYVYVYKFSAVTGYKWTLLRLAKTDANGLWSIADPTPYTTNYYAQFPETSTYFGSRTGVTPGV